MTDQSSLIARPKSLTALTCDALRQEILDGVWDMGEALSEAMVAKRLGVSRTPVREAFFQLGLEGLVRTEPQRGTFVFQLNREEMADICNVRCLIECEALRLVFASQREALAQEWDRITMDMETAHAEADGLRYLRLDTEFHQALLNLCGSEYLRLAYTPLSSKIIALRNRLRRQSEHLDKGFQEHKYLAQLVRTGNLDQAIATMRSHTLLVKGSYWDYSSSLMFS